MRSRAPKRANFAMDAGGHPLQISNAVRRPSRLEVVMRHAQFKGSPRRQAAAPGSRVFAHSLKLPSHAVAKRTQPKLRPKLVPKFGSKLQQETAFHLRELSWVATNGSG
jgi:hypothetical protein